MAKFSILNCIVVFGHFSPEAKSSASIIGPTGAFDTKKYKNVDSIFAVSACGEKNKKIFQISYFCSALSSLLVETTSSRSRRIPGNDAVSFPASYW
jgi:hypothetical protein